jgi:hypothetical protein
MNHLVKVALWARLHAVRVVLESHALECSSDDGVGVGLDGAVQFELLLSQTFFAAEQRRAERERERASLREWQRRTR